MNFHPRPNRLLLWVAMVAAVLRGGLVRKDFIKSHVIVVNPVAEGASDRWRAGSQIARNGGYRYIENVISESPAVWPSARDNAVTKAALNLANQHIAAEN